MSLGKLCVAAAGIAIAACDRPSTISVENTSGRKRILEVFQGDTGLVRDWYASETLPGGRGWCWSIPARASEKTLSVFVLDPDTASAMQAIWQRVVDPRSSWSLVIHMNATFDGTVEWRQRLLTRLAHADSAARVHGIVADSTGLARASQRIRSEESRSKGAPHDTLLVDLKRGNGCSATTPISGALAPWLVVGLLSAFGAGLVVGIAYRQNSKGRQQAPLNAPIPDDSHGRAIQHDIRRYYLDDPPRWRFVWHAAFWMLISVAALFVREPGLTCVAGALAVVLAYFGFRRLPRPLNGGSAWLRGMIDANTVKHKASSLDKQSPDK